MDTGTITTQVPKQGHLFNSSNNSSRIQVREDKSFSSNSKLIITLPLDNRSRIRIKEKMEILMIICLSGQLCWIKTRKRINIIIRLGPVLRMFNSQFEGG